MSQETENLNLEHMREVSNFKEISKTACAFANASGGVIRIGIANDGAAVGVPEKELDSLQQRIEGAIQQVFPMPFHKITIEKRGDNSIVSIEIYQIGQGSFCTFGGIVYYRSGSTNTKLEGKTLQDYMVKRQILSFDETISSAKMDDIDALKLKSFLKRRTPQLEFTNSKVKEYMINLNLARQNGELSIKNVCVLFFAKEPSRFLPQNEIRLVRFKGIDPVEIIDSRTSNLTILDNLQDALDFVSKNTRNAIRIEKLERKEVPEYPTEVIREVLVNAIVHRDYFSSDATQISIFDNRIEITNPGTLPNGLSLKILGTLSVQRNPITYRIMRDLGLVEGLATGIPRMRSSMRSSGLPEPVFQELGNFFRVTLYNSNRTISKDVTEMQRRALDYLKKNPLITSKIYEKMNSVSHPKAVSDLNKLVDIELLRRIGKTRGAYYVPANSS